MPLGGAISDYGDVLLDDEHGDQAVAALTDGLAAAARTALIDFREVRPGGAVERVYERWHGPRRRVERLGVPGAAGRPHGRPGRPGCPRPKPSGSVPSCASSTALGVERKAVCPDEVDSALRRLLELHQLQWQGRRVTAEHLRSRFCEHLVRSVGPMVRAGDAVVTEFRLDDDVVAVDLTLLSRRLAGRLSVRRASAAAGEQGGRGGDAAATRAPSTPGTAGGPR